MAIRQRLLEQMRRIEREMASLSVAAFWRAARDFAENLTAVRELCRTGLSSAYYEAYREIYDGVIFALSKAADEMSVTEREEAYSLCHDVISRLATALRGETHFKKEIVFLPYNASMWDSLESVWRAAVENAEHCLVYVIPIPYAELVAEREVKAWHWEKTAFPAYVPTVDYRAVDLAEMHPDVIFIHNPYDNCNTVTSVDPQYYSWELKKCTDCLVYIPYYVSLETTREEDYKNHALTPAALIVDRIIVQSPTMRQIYVNLLLKYTTIKDRPYWEKRILGLGSPKYDKVLSGTKEQFPLPDAWAQKIKGRKVLLYNTSLDSLLAHSDKVGAKLRRMFDFFSDREDVVLWWRPHPLAKATIQSLRPEIAAEYDALEQAYIDAGWGIYDDAADFYPAVFWSDAYYGDVSSVIYLYQKTGKPMLIQDATAMPTYRPYWMFDVYFDVSGEKLWFQPTVTNAIMSMECVTGNLCLENQFVPEDFISDQVWAYSLIRGVGHILVFVPFMETHFLSYDRETGRSMRTPLPVMEGAEYGFCPCFYGAALHGGSLFCFGRFPAIVEYRVESREIFCHTGQREGLAALLQDAFHYHNPHVEYQGRLWFVLVKNSTVVSFDYDSKDWKAYEVGDLDNQYLFIATDGVSLWLYSLSGTLVEWRPDTGECHSYTLPEAFCGHYFRGMAGTGSSLLLFPNAETFSASQIVAFDIETKEMRVFSAGEEGINQYLWATSMPGGHALAYEPYRREFHEYDERGRLYQTYPMRVKPTLDALWHISLMTVGEKMLQEHTMIGLEPFVNEVCAAPLRCEPPQRGGEQKTNGEKIMDYILQWRGKNDYTG